MSSTFLRDFSNILRSYEIIYHEVTWGYWLVFVSDTSLSVAQTILLIKTASKRASALFQVKLGLHLSCFVELYNLKYKMKQFLKYCRTANRFSLYLWVCWKKFRSSFENLWISYEILLQSTFIFKLNFPKIRSSTNFFEISFIFPRNQAHINRHLLVFFLKQTRFSLAYATKKLFNGNHVGQFYCQS